jgi:hypothetical protein
MDSRSAEVGSCTVSVRFEDRFFMALMYRDGHQLGIAFDEGSWRADLPGTDIELNSSAFIALPRA